jgi:hypothetical protein
VNEENTAGYNVEVFGFITEDLLRKVLKRLQTVKEDIETYIDKIRYLIEVAFEDVEDVKSLPPKKIREYSFEIHSVLLGACDHMKTEITRTCFLCPLKHQCERATR